MKQKKIIACISAMILAGSSLVSQTALASSETPLAERHRIYCIPLPDDPVKAGRGVEQMRYGAVVRLNGVSADEVRLSGYRLLDNNLAAYSPDETDGQRCLFMPLSDFFSPSGAQPVPMTVSDYSDMLRAVQTGVYPPALESTDGYYYIGFEWTESAFYPFGDDDTEDYLALLRAIRSCPDLTLTGTLFGQQCYDMASYGAPVGIRTDSAETLAAAEEILRSYGFDTEHVTAAPESDPPYYTEKGLKKHFVEDWYEPGYRWYSYSSDDYEWENSKDVLAPLHALDPALAVQIMPAYENPEALPLYLELIDTFYIEQCPETGDTDGSGKVDTDDAIGALKELTRSAVGLPSRCDDLHLFASDTDSDGALTTDDVIAMLKYITLSEISENGNMHWADVLPAK